MSFLATAWRALELARDYDDAVKAARVSLQAGGTVSDVVMAFAARTDSQLDDRAVEVLTEGAVKGIEWARKAASWAASLAAWVEDNGPKIAETAAKVGVHAVRIENRLESLL